MLDIPLFLKIGSTTGSRVTICFCRAIWHLQGNSGFLACMAFSACHEVSYALQVNAVFELRVHLLAEKSGSDDLKQSSVYGFGLRFVFVCVHYGCFPRVYHLHRLTAAQTDHSPLLLSCSPPS